MQLNGYLDTKKWSLTTSAIIDILLYILLYIYKLAGGKECTTAI